MVAVVVVLQCAPERAQHGTRKKTREYLLPFPDPPSSKLVCPVLLPFSLRSWTAYDERDLALALLGIQSRIARFDALCALLRWPICDPGPRGGRLQFRRLLTSLRRTMTISLARATRATGVRRGLLVRQVTTSTDRRTRKPLIDLKPEIREKAELLSSSWKGTNASGENTKNYIGGEFVESKTDKWIDVLDPVSLNNCM